MSGVVTRRVRALTKGEDDELEEAGGQSLYIDEKSIVSSTTPLLREKFEAKQTCMSLITEFFQLSQMKALELKMALRLSKFCRSIKRDKLKKRLMHIYYLRKGYTVNLMNVNKQLLVNITSYLSPLEKVRASQVCKEW